MRADTVRLLRATATPLVSIFGSGFLVIVPILNGAVWPYAVVAMAFVCALAFSFGSVIRYNILRAEPLLEAGTGSHRTVLFEHTSDLVLVVAYAISVCLYIRILAAFLLGGFGMDTPEAEHVVTVTIIVAIGVVGYTKGLEVLQNLEIWALPVTLVIMVLFLSGFGAYDLSVVNGFGIRRPEVPDHGWWEIFTIVGGTLIVVQGFETSRYLEEKYDSKTRVSSCRLSQLVSTAVYLIFIVLATPLMHFLGSEVKDTGLILLATEAAAWLAMPLVAAAVLSQFSAAVADTLGGGGNMAEATRGHVDTKHAFFYALQCFVAISVRRDTRQRMAMSLVSAALLFITFFAIPAA